MRIAMIALLVPAKHGSQCRSCYLKVADTSGVLTRRLLHRLDFEAALAMRIAVRLFIKAHLTPSGLV
jgi:hypothetical protein